MIRKWFLSRNYLSDMKGSCFHERQLLKFYPTYKSGPFKNSKVWFKATSMISWEDIVPWPASLLISLFLFQLHPWMT